MDTEDQGGNESGDPAVGTLDPEARVGTNGTGAYLPDAPHSLEDTGLSPSFLIELTLKIIHDAVSPTADQVVRVLGLPSSLVTHLLDTLKDDRMCQITSGSAYDLSSAYKFRLTERGEQRAGQALERCRYAGAAPVTLDNYQRVIDQQRLTVRRPSIDSIRRALEPLILDTEASDLLERALASGRAALLFGPSGNGKTRLLTEFVTNLEGEVLVPHAIFAHGQVIKIFDAQMHFSVETNGNAPKYEALDRRWVKVRRPGIIIGSEVSAEFLELGYDPLTHVYEAPKHLKAQGGVMVVDDFGRQRAPATELLARWMMALERGRDTLLLRTGESIELPFNITPLLSTNLDPVELADSTMMRRIPYIVNVPGTTHPLFRKILRKEAMDNGVACSDQELTDIVVVISDACGNQLSGSLASELVSIVVDNARHEGRKPEMTVAAVKLAYRQFSGAAGKRFGEIKGHSK